MHLHRKQQKKLDSTVYGVSADKYNFWFGKLGGNSQVSFFKGCLNLLSYSNTTSGRNEL